MIWKMKKNLVLVLVLSLTLVGCKKEVVEVVMPTEPNPYNLPAEALEPIYESVDYGFRVKGPETWVKQADSLGMLVTYLKPGDPDMFQENITIARELRGDLALESYASQTRDQILEFFEGAEIKGENETTIAGQPAVKFRYVLDLEGLVLETEQVVVERPSEFMVLTFMATPTQFAGAYPEFNKLLNSLEFVGSEMPS
jgi:hypothetical protein